MGGTVVGKPRKGSVFIAAPPGSGCPATSAVRTGDLTIARTSYELADICARCCRRRVRIRERYISGSKYRMGMCALERAAKSDERPFQLSQMRGHSRLLLRLFLYYSREIRNVSCVVCLRIGDSRGHFASASRKRHDGCFFDGGDDAVILTRGGTVIFSDGDNKMADKKTHAARHSFRH